MPAQNIALPDTEQLLTYNSTNSSTSIPKSSSTSLPDTSVMEGTILCLAVCDLNRELRDRLLQHSIIIILCHPFSPFRTSGRCQPNNVA